MTDNKVTHLQDRLDAAKRELWQLTDQLDDLHTRIEATQDAILELQRELGKAKEEAK